MTEADVVFWMLVWIVVANTISLVLSFMNRRK